jgi:hypothetical protein
MVQPAALDRDVQRGQVAGVNCYLDLHAGRGAIEGDLEAAEHKLGLGESCAIYSDELWLVAGLEGAQEGSAVLASGKDQLRR